MGNNPEWFYQLRARGICSICKQSMPDEDEKLAHHECYVLQAKGYTYKQIQESLRVKVKSNANKTAHSR
jgi:hypothetical protein